ncbi:MAG: tetratricopeptide repeat protein [bacterium]|nr:tetratricopeptide repeat protein [bacterium]
MVEILLLLAFILLILFGGYFYYQSLSRKPLRRSELDAFEKGLYELLDGDLQSSLKSLHLAAKEDPENVFIRIRIGEVLRKLGDLDRAMKIHLELQKREHLSNNERIAILRALVVDFEAANLPQQALLHLNQILALNKDHTWALEHSLKHLAEKGDWGAYLQTARRLATLQQKNIDSRRMAIVSTLEGDRLVANGKGKDGRLRYREAIKYDLNFPASYLGLAESYRQEKRYDEALQEINALVEHCPEYAELAFPLLETILFEQNRFDEVEKFYQKLTQQHLHLVHAYVALSKIVQRKGEYEKAMKILKEGLDLNPSNELIQFEYANLLRQMNRVDELAKLGLDVMKRLAPPTSSYVCKKCGFTAEKMRWYCPSCGSWESFSR